MRLYTELAWLRFHKCATAEASAALPQAAPMALWNARSWSPGASVSDMAAWASRMAAICAGVAWCAASAAHSGSISMRASSRSKGPMSSCPAGTVAPVAGCAGNAAPSGAMVTNTPVPTRTST
ncbi:hypothetical protein D3C73_1209990 [compost metagenome]